MASTAGTSWTCITMDLLRTSWHVEGREANKILKHLQPATLKQGTRFLSQQTKVTQGARHVRLDAWYYVRRVSDEDVISAVREAGCGDTALYNKIREAMETQKVYHVVVRGNDPVFMPPGDHHGTDIVTGYLCERVGLVREEVDKYLFEDLGNESAIRQFMQTPNFDEMLRVYFHNGDTEREETLHLVGRFHGPSNLLHSCIKEGHVETLRLLLERYTVESQQETRWRVLAEPLRGVGKYMVSAFHRAVFDGQRACLEELVEWANRHGHDITKLRNVEERNAANEPTVCLTCLELAEKEGNMGCYNVLAPIFGVRPTQDAVDRNTRSDRQALLRQPRVELLLFGSDTPENTIPLASFTWDVVLEAVGKLAGTRECRGCERSQVLFRICSVTFACDISADQAEQLFVAAAGASVQMERCEVKSERTLLALLATLVNRLEGDAGGELLPPACPMRVDVSSPVLDEPGTVDEERELDVEAAALVKKFVSLVGRWPGFVAARNGVLSVKQRIRLQRCDDGGRAWAAMWAAIYATRVSAFMFYDSEVEGQLQEWLRVRSLVPLARAVFKFYSPEELLTREHADARSALNPAVAHFLRFTLSAWFALFPTDVEDPWSAWAQRLGANVTQLDMQLAPALDIVLESLLRMWHALDFVCRGSPDVGASSIADLIAQCVPGPVLAGGHLPRTAARMAKYASPKVKAASHAGRLSLTAATAPTSLRPAWARPRVSRS